MRLKTALTADSVLDMKKADHYGVHFVRNFITDQHVYDQIHNLFTSAPYEYSHSSGRNNEPYNSYPARSENTEEQKALMEIVHNHFHNNYQHLFQDLKIDRPSHCYLLRYNEHTPEDSDLHLSRDPTQPSGTVHNELGGTSVTVTAAVDQEDANSSGDRRPIFNVVYSINSSITNVDSEAVSGSNTGAIAVSKYKNGLYPNNTTRDVCYYPIPHNSLYYIAGSQIHHGIAKTFCNRYVLVLTYLSDLSSEEVDTKVKRPALPATVHQCKQCYNYYLAPDLLRTHVQTHISNDNRRDRQRAEKAKLRASQAPADGNGEGENNLEGDDDAIIASATEGDANASGSDAAVPVVEAVEEDPNQVQAIAAAVVAAAVADNNSDSEDSAAVMVQRVAEVPKKTKGSKRARYERNMEI